MMDEKPLEPEERKYLLQIARQAIATALLENKAFRLDPAQVPYESARQPGASFVTLMIGGELRGCIGSLEPHQALYADVIEHALAAAFSDYRFSPLRRDELPDLEIEISRLTLPKRLEYETPGELLERLRPGTDGVTLQDGYRRATFLPQVWEKLPEKQEFLGHLCAKMGADPDLWKRKKLQVEVYQVEEFHQAVENM
jgi:AmmeMemoRadiSam system protein A